MTSISSNYSGYSNYSNYSNSSSNSSSAPDITSQLKALNIPDSVISQGPDAVASYAQQNGITLPAPPAKPNENSSTSGNSSSSSNSPKAEFEQKLESLGIPSSVISQGKDAVMQYAQENNITLPDPPKKGGTLDIQA